MSQRLREGKKDYSIISYWYCRTLFYFALHAYYKRVQMNKPSVLEKNVPTVVVMNHNNAFVDPVCCALHFKFRGYYMARGDAFKSKLAATLLYGIGILPIFRMSDGGRAGLMKNDISYRAFCNHLNRKKLIQIFPEAICTNEKRLKPIKKGTARMILNYLVEHQQSHVKVLPIGLNYSNAPKFESDLYLNAGESIDAGEYKALYLEDETKGMMELTKAIEEKMRPLVIEVETEYLDVFNILEEIQKNETGGNDLALHFHRSKALGLWVNEKAKTLDWESFKTSVLQYSEKLRQSGLRDHLLSAKQFAQLSILNLLMKSLVLLVLFPLFLIGFLGSLIPVAVIHYIGQNKIKDIIFKASAKVLLGVILFQIHYLMLFLILGFLTRLWLYSFLIVVMVAMAYWISNWYQRFAKKYFGSLRLYFLRSTEFAQQIIAARAKIVADISL